MQNREKIILSVAGMAMLYFVIDLFAVPALDAKQPPTDLAKECEAFLTRGKVTLSAVKSSPELFRRLTLLQDTDGERNPFIRDLLQKMDSAEITPSETAPDQCVRYTGYIESAGNRLVVINGREYSINQVIEGTDLLIKEISKDRVVLKPKNPAESDTEVITITKEVEDEVFKP